MQGKERAGIAEAVRDFMAMESAGGIFLLAATIVAMVLANSPLAFLYDRFFETTVAIQVGALAINKPLFLWINDGLMAVFFVLIGLEIKREIVEGELSSPAQIILPGFGALGGMLVPAAIYVWLNRGDTTALSGWAIPMATDIAFALALLSVFGRRVPIGLKVFLLSLAIFDDLAAIVVIALFYSTSISLLALLVAAVALALGVSMNLLGVRRTSAYLFVGLVMWVAVLKSGAHATLAGVLIAFCVPLRSENGRSTLRELEHDLHGPVAYAILPLFAFANAGMSFAGVSVDDFLNPVSLGIALGLLLGKPAGILLFVGLAVLLRIARLPENVGWLQLLGAACACGIGFTMSLFIAGLAFEQGSGGAFGGDRLGILAGSLLSAGAALAILQVCLPGKASAD